MEAVLENDLLKVTVNSLGAELSSIFSKNYHIEVLWQADPQIWGRHAPNLFPIVGNLNKDTYLFQDQPYSMPKHGFARNMEFEFTQNSSTSVTAVLKSSEYTQIHYPWVFEFTIEYSLKENRLDAIYYVRNTDDTVMYFSVGTHPGFNLHQPLDQCIVEFDQDDVLINIVNVHPEGLESAEKYIAKKRFFLSETIFDSDALVFAYLNSRNVTINTGRYMLRSGWSTEFPLLALWAKPRAPFICVEAWAGIADYRGEERDIRDKAYIETLEPEQLKTFPWFVEIQ